MARISGIDIPREKRVEIALTYIYGIGLPTSQKILASANVNPDTRVRDLTDDQVNRLREIIDRLKSIMCYRGMRHRRGLPVRGQRTRSNARTRKGPRKTVAGKKIAKVQG